MYTAESAALDIEMMELETKMNEFLNEESDRHFEGEPDNSETVR